MRTSSNGPYCFRGPFLVATASVASERDHLVWLQDFAETSRVVEACVVAAYLSALGVVPHLDQKSNTVNEASK